MDTNLIASLSVMVEQESTTHYSCFDYLNEDIGAINGNKDSKIRQQATESYGLGYEITSDDRAKLVDWCYQIVDNCRFNRETVAMAMNLANRFMCTPGAHDILYHRGNYQLVIITALYISIKLNEQLAFGSEEFAVLSNGSYFMEDIEEMEWIMLQGLSWRLSCPTSLQVARHILSLMQRQVQEKNPSLKQGTWDFILEEVAYQTEISIQDHYFMTGRPSTIVAAAILNAIEQLDDQDHTLLAMEVTSILREFDFETRHIKSVKLWISYSLE